MKQKPSVHLRDAADELINVFKTSDQFLIFLIDALGWVHDYEITNPNRGQQKDSHFALELLLRHIYLPWQKSKDPGKEMADGMMEIANVFEGEFREIMPGLMSAYAYELESVGTPTLDISNRDLAGLKALTEIGYYLSDNAEFEENQKKAAA